METVRGTGRPVEGDVRSVLRAQQRRRRVRFWLGFGAILLVGGLWAGLTKDPARPDLLNRFGGVDVAVEAEAVEFAPAPVPAVTTTVGP